MVHKRTIPDGRALVVGWIAPLALWRVRVEGSQALFEARALGDALALAAGAVADREWLKDLERELAAGDPIDDATRGARPPMTATTGTTR